MTSLPLPSNPYPPGEIFDAYETCLWIERRQQYAIDAKLDRTLLQFTEKHGPILLGRFLGHLVLDCPNDDGRQNISQDINDCNRNFPKLGTVGHIYLTSLIRIFRNPKGPTSTPLSHPALDEPIKLTKEQLLEPGSSKAAKEVALRRDNYRCPITGTVDVVSDLSTKTSVSSDSEFNAPTQLAHIISQFTTEGINLGSDYAKRKLHWASSACAVMERFGGVSFLSELNGKNVHRPQNTFTISVLVHCDSPVSFDQLGIALERRGNPEHTYDVVVYPDSQRRKLRIKEKVTFRNHDLSEDIPLPDPRYLALHAACARVVHMSGAAEVIDKFLKDYEEKTVLAEDGSSAETLFYALDTMSTQLNPAALS